MSNFRYKSSIRAMAHPKHKKYVKQQMNKKRRQLLNQGLESVKQAYNNNLDINDIDYYMDKRYIKIKSRHGIATDYIERRTTNSRLIIGDCW